MHKRALATALARSLYGSALVRDPPASEREAAWTGRIHPLTEPRRRLKAWAWQTISPSTDLGLL